MRKRITTIIFMTALSWAFQVDAGPIGDRPRIWPEFQYRFGAADSPFSGALDGVDDETIALDLLFGEIEYAPEVGGDSASSSNEEGRPKIPVNAFIFSYGEYRHQWEVPRHQAPRAPIVVQEPTFQYRGPLPEPEPPAVDREEDPYKYRYPEELIKPVHRHPTGLVDTFELEYSLQLEADAAHYMYPFAPKDIPEPEQRVFRYGKVSPGTGAGGLHYGQAQRQPRYEAGYGDKGESRAGKTERRRRVDNFRHKTTTATEGPSYSMILLGAGLAAVAALFRMFRLSLFILVGWMFFYGRDLWQIIVALQ